MCLPRSCLIGRKRSNDLTTRPISWRDFEGWKTGRDLNGRVGSVWVWFKLKAYISLSLFFHLIFQMWSLSRRWDWWGRVCVCRANSNRIMFSFLWELKKKHVFKPHIIFRFKALFIISLDEKWYLCQKLSPHQNEKFQQAFQLTVFHSAWMSRWLWQ